nr:AMP deaminase-like [Tanacetum cinerariifolium]
KNVFNHYFWEDGTYLEFMPWAIDAISGENADVTLKRELERCEYIAFENANANANAEQLPIAAAALIRSHSVFDDLQGVQPDL